MKQPVTRDRNNESEIIMMDMSEVLYIQTEDGAVVFHTSNGRVYPLVPSLSMYAKHTESMGFRKLDRTNLVNMKKLKAFDEKRGLVYFDEAAHTERPSAIVAFMNMGKLKEMIKFWIDRNVK
ncbi:LytR family transcriptional regulator [Cohnella endophytica]|uniref:LytR family transcriptional regulator n=1 Tax=Cohnella endophytica TaxID=2419778 RepID=A0A494XRB5_9BACL|nr:LytTR family transcriptional regulator DNA-binding domain-containing protein [Cohnella endophytica]RKP53177.1 LytR family transcriptional regulator [Cohnella endophytica]